MISMKNDMAWTDSNGGLDASALIPLELGGTMQPVTKPMVSVMDLGKMLLHCAREGETTKVRELMTRGAPFTTDWLGTSPLHVAASNNHYDTCEVLLRAGISKNARTKVDRTPLHFAVYEGHESIVQLLLTNKCEIDAKDMLKMTPLHWAVLKKFRSIANMLLSHGADPRNKSKFQKSPITIATETEQNDLLQTLLYYRSKIIDPDPEQLQATESLVSELKRQRPEDEIEPILMDDVEESSYNSTLNSPLYSADNDRLNGNSSMHFDETIGKLTNYSLDTTKQLDSSTLQMLKDHGISMLDDSDNTVLDSALQSGRKLVLSDAGKLIFNDPKFKRNTLQSPLPLHRINQWTPSTTAATTSNNIITNTNATSNTNTRTSTFNNTSTTKPILLNGITTKQSAGGGGGGIKLEHVRRKITGTSPPMLVPTSSSQFSSSSSSLQNVPTNNNNNNNNNNMNAPPVLITKSAPYKTNKVIKILSAEEFKQMYSQTATANSLKKVSTDSINNNNGQVKYQTISNSNILTQLSRSKKQQILNKVKLKSMPSGNIVSKPNDFKITGIKPVGQIHHQIQNAKIPTQINQSQQNFKNTNESVLGVDVTNVELLSRISYNSPLSPSTPTAGTNNNLSGVRNIMSNSVTSAIGIGSTGPPPPTTTTTVTSSTTRPMTMSEVERQLIELRKQTDELRKQLELSQKQNEDYRVRLEKVEREMELQKDDRYQLFSNS